MALLFCDDAAWSWNDALEAWDCPRLPVKQNPRLVRESCPLPLGPADTSVLQNCRENISILGRLSGWEALGTDSGLKRTLFFPKPLSLLAVGSHYSRRQFFLGAHTDMSSPTYFIVKVSSSHENHPRQRVKQDSDTQSPSGKLCFLSQA